MPSKKMNPAANGRAREFVKATSTDDLENSRSPLNHQVRRLIRLHALSRRRALLVAALHFAVAE